MKWLLGEKERETDNLLDTKYPENWNEIRTQVLMSDNYKCGNCGSTVNLDVHHIVPISKGGTNNFANLKTICRECHKKIHPHLD